MTPTTIKNCFCGSVTMGERGQIVIPAELRRALSLDAGDRLLVFRHPANKGMMLSKLDGLQELVEAFQHAIDSVDPTAEENQPLEEEHK